MRADRAAGGARRRPHRPRDPEDHRALDRDRQPRGRHVRRPRDPCHGRLGAGRDGRGAGGGHPRAGRGHGRLRRGGRRRGGGRGALAGLALPPERDLLYQGFRSACRAAGREPPPGLVLEASSDIPIARGLGSSAAAVVAGAAAAAGLLALDLSDAALAALCAELEGHPDNVAAAIYGGATLVLRGAAGELAFTPLPVHPSLVLVFAVPDFRVETGRARAGLPHVVPHPSPLTAAAPGAAVGDRPPDPPAAP